MNSFERHGIEHLSASSINLFAASPALFVLEKVLKRRTGVGAAAHRGSAVEAGIMLGLLNGADDDACIAEAKKIFGQKTALSGDPRREHEAESLAAMVINGLNELRPYGKPSSVQGRIDHRVEGLQVPIIGYYDAEWIDHGILFDLKTTHRVPSEISTNHARQVALYKACRGDNIDARISYCSTKKVATYRLENAAEHLRAIERIALTIQRFLAVSDDPQEFVGITVPDTDSFYFSDPNTRQAVFETWGF